MEAKSCPAAQAGWWRTACAPTRSRPGSVRGSQGPPLRHSRRSMHQARGCGPLAASDAAVAVSDSNERRQLRDREAMPTENDMTVLVRAAAALTVRRRGDLQRWTHLSLCVLDAVFSINAHYTGVRRACQRYAHYANLAEPVLPGYTVGRVIGTAREQAIDQLAKDGRDLGPKRFARDVLGHEGRTSPHGTSILKAEAAIRCAEILAAADVHVLGDVAALAHDSDRLAAVEDELRTVPGNGTNDVRLGYLWMNTGQDHLVKPDRMVLRWLTEQLGRRIDVPTARRLLSELAARLGCTSWEVDRAIWLARSGRTTSGAPISRCGMPEGRP